MLKKFINTLTFLLLALTMICQNNNIFVVAFRTNYTDNPELYLIYLFFLSNFQNISYKIIDLASLFVANKDRILGIDPLFFH